MEYIELRISTTANKLTKDLLPSILSELGFEGFVVEEEALLAYIPSKLFNLQIVKEVLQNLSFDSFYNIQIIPEQDWNAVWESQFEPVVIAEKCYVRAPFHPPQPQYPIELIIEPKMSFGTAHHETTAIMIECLLEMDLTKKSILDMGSGTGILAILSAKLGADHIVAIDNDEWAYRNALENIQLNNTLQIIVKLGDASLLSAMNEFDMVLANINRNVLLNDVAIYSSVLKRDGLLIVSGFYRDDFPLIDETFHKQGLKLNFTKDRNNWLAAAYVKNLS